MIQWKVAISVLQGISTLYWILIASALALVFWKIKSGWGKALGALLVVCVFGYVPLQRMMDASEREVYEREAWSYFKKQCDEKSGEKILKTFDGVKSVLAIKPLPPASEKDLQDQFWLGNPYSDATPWAKRAELAASILADPVAPIAPGKIGRGFDFVESVSPTTNQIIKYHYPEGTRKSVAAPVDKAVSRFALSWEDISRPEDRKYWVAGSRLRIIDLTDDSVIAERIGYFIEAGFGSTVGQRRPWLASRGPNTTCPAVHDYMDRWFVLKVLKPN